MQQIESVDGVRDAVCAAKMDGHTVGCVMTMGALHAGHRSLLELARRECDLVVATIFVNPTQFAPHEDLNMYPRPIENDLSLCDAASVDAVFLPSVETMYPVGSQTTVTVDGVSKPLEGEFRPTHFQGVATVVLKLLNIVQPDVAYFGQKDYQQCAVIRQMVRDLNLPVEIRTAPTVRDPDGLALSSRNQYLSADERIIGLSLSKALELAEQMLVAGTDDVAEVESAMAKLLFSSGVQAIDYVAVADPDTLERLTQPQSEMVALIAAKVGTTRLIDNRIIRLR